MARRPDGITGLGRQQPSVNQNPTVTTLDSSLPFMMANSQDI
jgi:hypothetical protein